MKNQKFGVEIELTGITRRDAAKVIADYFETTSTYEGTYVCLGILAVCLVVYILACFFSKEK